MNYYNYFTEIEEHFVRRRGKHLLISPMDWSLIATWRDSGIPLHVALRGIDKAMDSFYALKQPIGKVNSLFYCHDTVMSEYARHLESRVGEEPSECARRAASSPEENIPKQDEGPDRQSVLGFLASRINEINALLAKHSEEENGPFQQTVHRVLSRLEEITCALEANIGLDLESLERDLGILDETLIAELRSFVSPETIAEWEEEAKKELKVYKKRLPKETFQKILENFLRGKIHRHFDVGELSLFYL